jgi:hypothetical protein
MTGCHFFNNSWGITSAGMANMYVRNSRFDSNGFKFQHRVGPAVYVYEGADIALAKSAGASVRRCVSVNGTRFVASPGSETGSPTTIEGNVIDSWRGHAAISGGLRGPYILLDNAFTNGSGSVSPHDPYSDPVNISKLTKRRRNFGFDPREIQKSGRVVWCEPFNVRSE